MIIAVVRAEKLVTGKTAAIATNSRNIKISTVLGKIIRKSMSIMIAIKITIATILAETIARTTAATVTIEILKY